MAGFGVSTEACALAHAAPGRTSPSDISVSLAFVDELAKAEALQKKSGFFRSLAKAKALGH